VGLRRTSAALVSALIAASFLAATAGPAAADPATVPDPPTNIGVVSRSESVVVSFDPPADDGGSPITQYRATCISPDANSSAQAFGTESPIVVYAMVNTYWYVCTVVATNAIGDSDFSDGSDQVVPNLRAPDTPVDVQVASPADTDPQVTFTVPYDGGDANLWYAADCESSDGGTQRTANYSVLPMTVWGLTPGKTYTCRGKASQQYGSSSWSDPSDPFVVQFVSTVPDPPTITTVEPHYESILVSFDPPANDGGAPIIGYTVNCESDDGGAASLATGAGSPMLVRTVTNTHNYNCTVSAQNGNGYGDPSDLSDDVVPAAQLPNPPTDLEVTMLNSSVASITFTPGADDGSGLWQHDVDCTSSDGGEPVSFHGTTVSPQYVNDLTPFKHYECIFTPINAVGSGTPSDPVSFYTDVVPNPPTLTEVTRRNHGASVTFTDQIGSGSAITHYELECASSDGGAPASILVGSSPGWIDSLDVGNTYACTVKAVNSEGSSAPSNPSDSFVVGSVPGAPTVTNVGNTERGAIEVSFDPPDEDGYSDITRYDARCTSSDGGIQVSNFGADSPIVVRGLTYAKSYDCDAVAMNEFGFGDYGPTQGPVTIDVAEPGAPELDEWTLGHTSITFEIGVSDDGGSAITSYDVACTSSNGGAAGTWSSSTPEVIVSNLTAT
jgi:titin